VARKKGGLSASDVLLLLAMAVALVIVVAVPLIWIWVEAERLRHSKPLGGFTLDPDELRSAEANVQIVASAEAQRERLQREAAQAGCRLRQDGRLDERSARARALNPLLDQVRGQAEQGRALLQDALAGPQQRYAAWSSGVRWSWALRAVMLAWGAGGVWLATAPGDPLEALGLANGGVDAWIAAGVLALPAVAVAAVVAAIAYGIAGTAVDGSAPAEGLDLLHEARQAAHAEASTPDERVSDSSNGDASDGDASDGDASDGDASNSELGPELAHLLVHILMWTAEADGSVSAAERERIREVLGLALKQEPALHTAALGALLSTIPEESVAREGCEIFARTDAAFSHQICLMVALVAEAGGPVERIRAQRIAAWLGLDPDEAEAVLAQADQMAVEA
jgi:uncharacterized tellurite resistance protein B-like protein